MLICKAFVHARHCIGHLDESFIGDRLGEYGHQTSLGNGVPHLFIGVVYKYPELPLYSQRGQWPKQDYRALYYISMFLFGRNISKRIHKKLVTMAATGEGGIQETGSVLFHCTLLYYLNVFLL